MTFLPIVSRELRVASRRKAVYWLRFLLSAVALLVAVGLANSLANLPQYRSGRVLFAFLSGMTFCYALAAGAVHTADCLSWEKREGTLGLLFLTDLRSHDITLGKLVSSSLNSFYAVVSILPVLAVSLLMGGVNFGEFLRMTLVLLLTVIWSLTLGMMFSAFFKQASTTVSATIAIVCVLTLLPFLMRSLAILSIRVPDEAMAWVSYLSPLGLMLNADAAAYAARGGASQFCRSAGFVALTALAAFLAATWYVPRSWRQTGPTGPATHWVNRFWTWVLMGNETRRRRMRPLLHGAPYAWLIRRDRWTQILTWGLMIFILPIWLWFYGQVAFAWDRPESNQAWMAGMWCLVLSLIMHLTVKSLLIMDSIRQASADAATGALEFLLVAPLSIRQILQAHARAMNHVFRIPLFILATTNLLLLAVVLKTRHNFIGAENRETMILILIGGAVFVFLDARAIMPLGLWLGFKYRRPQKAAWLTRVYLFVPCYGLLLLLLFSFANGSSRGWQNSWVLLLFFYLASLVTDLMARQFAIDQLTRNLRRVASGDPAEEVFSGYEQEPMGRIGQ